MKDFNIENGNFTTTFNDIFKYQKDGLKLSLEAWGLYVFMLSLPADWDYTIKGLQSVINAGRNKIMSTLNELENAGFLKREQKRKSGQFSSTSYTILRQLKTPLSRKPTTAKNTLENESPLSRKPTSENGPQQKTKEQKTDKLMIKGVKYPPHFHYLTKFLIDQKIINAVDFAINDFNELFKDLDYRYDIDIVNRATRYVADVFKRRVKDGFKPSNFYAWFSSSLETNCEILLNVKFPSGKKTFKNDLIKNPKVEHAIAELGLNGGVKNA